MAIQPSYNTGSQLSRAIAAYLQSVPLPSVNVFADMGVQDIPYPNVIVKSHTMETLSNVDYEQWQVQIQMRQSAADNPNAQNQDGDTWVALNALVGMVKGAMLQTPDGLAGRISATMAGLITAAGNALSNTGPQQAQANNADMASFTCLQCYFKGHTRGEPEEEGADWVEILNFECHAVPAVVS